MIEVILLKFLNEKLEYPCFMEEPKEAKKRFIKIQKIGSKRKNYIDFATIAIQSYGETMEEAAKLNEKVKNAMIEFSYKKKISRVKIETDYNFTETQKERYRYQAIFQIIYY